MTATKFRSTATEYRSVDVDGLEVFYREAGNPEQPTLLLLHGYPTASYLFHDLIPLLADRFHLLAPDIPGFGETELVPRSEFDYTFENLTDVIDRFTEIKQVDRYAIYVFDYGAPVGFRLAVRHPERVLALITQNGNAYVEGLSEGWNPIQAYWKTPSAENRNALRNFLGLEATRWQYTHGVADPNQVAPESYTL